MNIDKTELARRRLVIDADNDEIAEHIDNLKKAVAIDNSLDSELFNISIFYKCDDDNDPDISIRLNCEYNRILTILDIDEAQYLSLEKIVIDSLDSIFKIMQIVRDEIDKNKKFPDVLEAQRRINNIIDDRYTNHVGYGLAKLRNDFIKALLNIQKIKTL